MVDLNQQTARSSIMVRFRYTDRRATRACGGVRGVDGRPADRRFSVVSGWLHGSRAASGLFPVPRTSERRNLLALSGRACADASLDRPNTVACVGADR